MTRPKRWGAAARPPACLLRLHRHSLASILVIGGTASEREAMARAFHRASPIRDRPFMALDCGRDEAMLRSALQGWLLPGGGVPHPLGDVEGGTLFLERIERLSPLTQQQLLVLAHHLRSGLERGSNLPARLAAGCGTSLLDAPRPAIARELLDCLDKIRVELGVAGRRPAREKAAGVDVRARRTGPQGAPASTAGH